LIAIFRPVPNDRPKIINQAIIIMHSCARDLSGHGDGYTIQYTRTSPSFTHTWHVNKTQGTCISARDPRTCAADRPEPVRPAGLAKIASNRKRTRGERRLRLVQRASERVYRESKKIEEAAARR
jgi:hypothetical protein